MVLWTRNPVQPKLRLELSSNAHQSVDADYSHLNVAQAGLQPLLLLLASHHCIQCGVWPVPHSPTGFVHLLHFCNIAHSHSSDSRIAQHIRSMLLDPSLPWVLLDLAFTLRIPSAAERCPAVPGPCDVHFCSFTSAPLR